MNRFKTSLRNPAVFITTATILVILLTIVIYFLIDWTLR